MVAKKDKVGNVPNLRFPEFEGEWEELDFSELGTFFKGKGISKEQLSEKGNPCILYGELYTKYKTEVIDRVLSHTALDISGLVKSRINDVIIPSSGESAFDIATACCVNVDDILLGGDLNIIRMDRDNGTFISYQLNGKRKKDIAKLAQGSSVTHLYNDSLKKLRITLPKRDEQKKIASFLAKIDERISTQNKIIDDFQSLMDQLTQNLLSQKIRYKIDGTADFANWNYKKIGEVLKIGSGKDYKHLNHGDVPVYGTGGLMTYVDAFVYDGETVCIGRKGTIDKPMFHKGKLWTVDTLFYTYSFIDTIPKFIYYVFKTINWKEHNEASSVPSLSKSTIEKIEIPIPSKNEQILIANLLTSIEEKIKVEKQILRSYEKQKQHLLSNLFI